MKAAPEMIPNVSKRFWPLGLSRGRPTVRMSAGLAAFGPFLVIYFHNLWDYCPHYEFFPLVLIVFACLLRKRWPRCFVERSALTVVLSTVLMWAGLSLLVTAVLLYSPWLAAVGFVVSTGGVLLHATGRDFWGDIFPVWLLLWLTIRPPWRLDDQIMQFLQNATTETASRLLDWAGVLHINAGNVFQLPGRELFVAEACSGVHSQFILFAAAAIWVVVERRTWLHASLLLAAAVFWSVAMNTLRVASVVYAAGGHEIDLSHGWQHELLGIAVVLLGFLLILCTDRLLVALLAPVRDIEGMMFHFDGAWEPENTLARLWNRLIFRGRRRVRTETQGETPPMTVERSGVEENVGSAARTDCLLRDGGTFTVLSWRVYLGTATALAALQVLALCVGPRQVHLDVSLLSDAFQRNSLPVQAGPWRQAAYETKERELRSDQGHFSHIWRYRMEGQTAHISVDFPFVGWHELTRCYQSRGWAVLRRRVLAEDTESDGGKFVEVEFRKPTGQFGLLQFCLWDGVGRPVAPRASHWTGIWGKLAANPLVSLVNGAAPPVATSLSTMQVQQFLLSNGPLDDRRRELAREQFLRCRTKIYYQYLRDREGSTDE